MKLPRPWGYSRAYVLVAAIWVSGLVAVTWWPLPEHPSAAAPPACATTVQSKGTEHHGP